MREINVIRTEMRKLFSKNIFFQKHLFCRISHIALVRLTFQRFKKCNSRNYKIFLKWIHQMKRCCCFLLTYHQEQIKKKKKRKGRRMREIFKKRIEKGVYHNLLQKIRVNDREPHFR